MVGTTGSRTCIACPEKTLGREPEYANLELGLQQTGRPGTDGHDPRRPGAQSKSAQSGTAGQQFDVLRHHFAGRIVGFGNAIAPSRPAQKCRPTGRIDGPGRRYETLSYRYVP